MSLSISDLDEQIERLKNCEYLRETEVKALCAKAREILIDESNVQRVDAPVTVSIPTFMYPFVLWLHKPLSFSFFNAPISLSYFSWFASIVTTFVVFLLR